MESKSDLNENLQRLNRALQAAHRSSIDVKNSYDFYILSIKELNKDNLQDSFLYYDRSEYELTNAINDSKYKIRGFRVHSLSTISFFFKLYGLYAIFFGILSCFLFGFLIYGYSLITVLDVPLWASLFAGLGSSAQILTGAMDDLLREGTAIRYKRVWYISLPLLSLIFGFMAYAIFNSGLIAFNINSENSTFSAIFICFLTGFLTNWLIRGLSHYSRNP